VVEADPLAEEAIEADAVLDAHGQRRGRVAALVVHVVRRLADAVLLACGLAAEDAFGAGLRLVLLPVGLGELVAALRARLVARRNQGLAVRTLLRGRFAVAAIVGGDADRVHRPVP